MDTGDAVAGLVCIWHRDPLLIGVAKHGPMQTGVVLRCDLASNLVPGNRERFILASCRSAEWPDLLQDSREHGFLEICIVARKASRALDLLSCTGESLAVAPASVGVC